MSQDDELQLRKSLAAVDGQRRSSLVTLAAAGILTLLAFLRLAGAFRADTGDISRLLQLTVVAFLFWTSMLAVVIIRHVSATTRRILRAIELASRPE